MRRDVTASAQADKARAQFGALRDSALPLVKADMFAPPVFTEVLPRGQFRIW